MGGKHKQGNRTKNNARPSSSSHSAELLGNTIPTFYGFSLNKDGVSTVSGFPMDDANYSINSDFQIMLKQMNKKDPTTRFKALQMFTNLCNNSDVNTVKGILPLWPRMYCTLCTDIDHKVREVAHIAHNAVVSKVKKMIAPYLKELVGPWFTSQYDTYAPAATAATLAFQEAFPPEKQNKAIMFCQEEILSYIFDNLINQTPQSLSNPNTTSPEDMQAKYERTIIASLQGYTLYLEKLSTDQIKEAEESNRKLLSSAKFWNYAKNKLPLVRSCFFQALIALCQKARFLLQASSARITSAVFTSLDESDPVVLQAVWDAALNVLVKLEDCWSHINLEKHVFEKLCVVLRHGGRNASTIYPNILPLLSKLPDDLILDKRTFFANLFENMRCGLGVDTYAQSTSEAKIIAETFVECLKYIVMKNSSDSEFCDSLLANQLMPALRQKLSVPKVKKPLATPFFTQTSRLLHYWFSNRDGNATYERLVENFFVSLHSLCCEQLRSEVTRASLGDVLGNQMDFLCVLLDPSAFSRRSKGRVKFEEDGEREDAVATKDPVDQEFAREMVPLVKRLAGAYLKAAIREEEKSYLPPISRMVQVFDSKPIFEEMVAAVDESTCFKLFSSYFSKWLMKAEMKCGELVDLSFSLLKHVTTDEKEYILEEFCNNWFSDALQLSVCKALASYSEDDSIIKWARSEKFAASVLRLVERFVEGDGKDGTSQDIIMMLLKAKCANGEFVIDSNTSGSIMDMVSMALVEERVPAHVVKLSRDLIENATREEMKEASVEELLASLFKLWCCQPGDENLRNACETGLRTVLESREQGQRAKFTKKLSEVIGTIVASDKIKFLPEQIVANVNAFIELATKTNLRDSRASNEELRKALEIVNIFLEGSSRRNESAAKMLEKCCRVAFEGAGNLSFEYLESVDYLKVISLDRFDELDLYPTFELGMVKRYAKWNLYAGGILNLVGASQPQSYRVSALTREPKAYAVEGERESTQEDDDIIPVKISKEEESRLRSELEAMERLELQGEPESNMMEPLLGEIRRFLLSVGLLECFNKFYANRECHRELKALTERLKASACDLLRNVNFVEFNFIYDHCRVFIRRESLWWIVGDSFVDIFNRRFLQVFQTDTAERHFHEMRELEIKNQPKHWGNYLKLLTYIQKGYGHRFGEANWDSIFVFVHDCFKEYLSNPNASEPDLISLSAAARLVHELIFVFTSNHTQPFELRVPSETCVVWNEVVKAELYKKCLLTWRTLAASTCDVKDYPLEWHVALQNVSDVVITGLPLRQSKDLDESVELEIECGQLMTSSNAVIQMTAFRLGLSIVPDLVKLDSEMFGNQVTQLLQDATDTSSLFNKNSNAKWTARHLAQKIGHTQGIVETLLSDFIIGDCCTVEPFTDSYTYTYSYLLLWCFLLEMCGEAHSPLRFQYGCWLQDAGYSNAFLESVFKLMPQTALHGSEAKENCRKHFESYDSLDFREPVESERIERIACFAYRLFLQRLPNVVREWWNQVENKTSGLVDKVTTLYVSPLLIANELKNVQQDRETRFDNMEIKTYPNSREVVATYVIDEVKMDLVMTLPPNYPLGTIKIDSSNVLIGTSNWRNWLFQVSKYLIHQNGTIWDALVIWKNNLDKKFEGVEECYICFSILLGSSFETPRLCCHTCKKKFHSNCLYKWFSTSNKSTCPICRNLF